MFVNMLFLSSFLSIRCLRFSGRLACASDLRDSPGLGVLAGVLGPGAGLSGIGCPDYPGLGMLAGPGYLGLVVRAIRDWLFGLSGIGNASRCFGGPGYLGLGVRAIRDWLFGLSGIGEI